jgi:hypothetical protein
MFSLEIYDIYVIMTLRYILTNINYTFVSFLRSFKLQLITPITYWPMLFVIFMSELV